MRRRTDFHRCRGDIEIRELLELVVHARQLLLDMFGSVRDLFFDPGNIQEHPAVRTTPPGLDLAHDAPRDVVSSQQLGRAPCSLIALTIAPTFFFVVSGLMLIRIRNVVEHEAATLIVAQHSTFAANAFGNENAGNAGWPDHSRRMELYELHVHQISAGVVSERVPVAGVFPTVAGDLVGAADSARGYDDRFGLKQKKSSALAIVAKCSDNAVSLFKQRDDGALHVHVNSLVNAVILKCADHFKAGPVADVRETRIPMSTKIPLKDISFFCSIENCAPRFQLTNTGRRLFGVQLGHLPVVHVLAAAHRVREVNSSSCPPNSLCPMLPRYRLQPSPCELFQEATCRSDRP